MADITVNSIEVEASDHSDYDHSTISVNTGSKKL